MSVDQSLVPCDNCAKSFPLHELDAKPTRLAGPGNWFVRYLMPSIRRRAISDAWSNEDFDRLECSDCYGPGFVCSV